MKTQIITLASHDDLISVRDKLSWAKSPRVLLVWPKYEKITLRLLDLKVLQRHADSLGAQLGLVTRRLKVRRDAEALGIPVFPSASAAQKKAWPQPVPRTRRIPPPPRKDLRAVRETVYPKEAAWRTSLASRVILFALGVFSVLGLTAIFLPRAELTLFPQMQEQSLLVPVLAGMNFQEVTVTGEVPSRELTLVVGDEQSMAITGFISLPKDRSSGVVRFSNLGISEIEIPVGTVVSSVSGEKYVTREQIFLAGGVKEFVETPVEAVLPGAQGNVQSEIVTLVEGPLALLVTVTNPEPMTGGTNIRQPGAANSDREALRSELLEEIKKKAEVRLISELKPGDVALIKTLVINEILSEEFDPAAGQPGKSLKLSMQVEFKVNYVASDDLHTLSRKMLDPALPEGFSVVGDPSFEVISEASGAEGASRLEVEITRDLLQQLDPLQVFSSIRGRNVDELPLHLKSAFSMRQAPEISVQPDWWPWMPLLPLNISIEAR